MHMQNQLQKYIFIIFVLNNLIAFKKANKENTVHMLVKFLFFNWRIIVL